MSARHAHILEVQGGVVDTIQADFVAHVPHLASWADSKGIVVPYLDQEAMQALVRPIW